MMGLEQECLIWKPAGTWLQTVDDRGRVWVSYVARVPRASAEGFCVRWGLTFIALDNDVQERREAA
jgi:hypothetical protein